MEKCKSKCNDSKSDNCQKAKDDFSDCLSNTQGLCSEDLNRDGVVDHQDMLLYSIIRAGYNWYFPPFMPYPPGFGDGGPGSIDDRLVPGTGAPDDQT